MGGMTAAQRRGRAPKWPQQRWLYEEERFETREEANARAGWLADEERYHDGRMHEYGPVPVPVPNDAAAAPPDGPGAEKTARSKPPPAKASPSKAPPSIPDSDADTEMSGLDDFGQDDTGNVEMEIELSAGEKAGNGQSDETDKTVRNYIR